MKINVNILSGFEEKKQQQKQQQRKTLSIPAHFYSGVSVTVLYVEKAVVFYLPQICLHQQHVDTCDETRNVRIACARTGQEICAFNSTLKYLHTIHYELSCSTSYSVDFLPPLRHEKEIRFNH